MRKLIDDFTREMPVLAFDEAAAAKYGTLAAGLALRGTPIGTIYALSAAHALSTGLTFVTNNEKHFRVIPGLKVETWLT